MASPSPEGMSYSILLKSFVGEHQQQQQQQIYNQYYSTPEKLEQLLSRLEKERLKIDGLKRELPLCMQLLNNAVETSRQQLQAFRGNTTNINYNNNDNNNNDQAGPVRPVLEEFMPLKTMSDTSSDQVDKANWMTTAQLWSQESSHDTKPTPTTLLNNANTNDIAEIGLNVITPPPQNNNNKLGGNLDIKPRNGGGGGGGGAFIPFSKERNLCPPSPVLALAPNDREHHHLATTNDMLLIGDKKCTRAETDSDHTTSIGFSCIKPNNINSNNNNNSVGAGDGGDKNNAIVNNNNTTTSQAQSHRKARRCWSPDLHRRFVNALQMLGGSQVATPKQIRELMKVDGLTNDEVKSHLQKYRLHTRRPGPSPQGSGTPTPQLVVLGGIWVPPDYATAAAAAHGGAPPLYGAHPAASHPPPPHFCTTSPMPQEFYTAAMTQPLPLPAPLPLHVYKPSSQTQSLPDSDLKGNRERSESIEDGKSESSSCKDEW